MSEWITNDGGDDHCFGCGQRNEDGLRLRFRQTGESSVKADYTVPAIYRGPDGIVHGGIQATLLDEVLGMAVHVGAAGWSRIVTAELQVRYRRPVPTGAPLTIRGRVTRVEEPNYFAEGEILDASGEVLTSAEARWRRMG